MTRTIWGQLFFATVCITAALAVHIRPPGIYKQPQKDTYFSPGETVELPCVADGYPEVRYTWKRNGVNFDPSGNDNRIVQLANVGTIVINRTEDKDEGIFQCLADNGFGISMTDRINLREAKLNNFPTGHPRTYTRELGTALTLNCIPPTSYPKAEVAWALKDSSGKYEGINYNDRVTMDLEGRLHFTNLKPEDHQNGKAYVCMAINYYLRRSSFDHGRYINFVGTTEIKMPPQYLWTTPGDNFGLVGEKFQMKCIFSGNPTPEVVWTKNGNILRPEIEISQGGQEITIPSLMESDEGNYECYGNNSLGQSTPRAIFLRVESKPRWKEEPNDIEASEGDKATFLCEAEGKPTPKISWYVNGVPINESTDDTVNSNRFLKPNDKNVTIVDLQPTDRLVIQCNCTNNHGYVFSDVYLNVLSHN